MALAVPIYRCFDYLSVAGQDPLPGARVRVVFGKREVVGVVVEAARVVATAEFEYRPIIEVIDTQALLPAEVLSLCSWVAGYYQQPLGEVIAAALPGPLRRGLQPRLPRRTQVALTPAGHAALLGAQPPRGVTQKALMRSLMDGACDRAALLERHPGAGGALARLSARGWVQEQQAPVPVVLQPPTEPPELQPEQALALSQWRATRKGFGVTLLQGVTGSGKTEIYLRAAADVLAGGCQVLVLVPEIGLTPQILERFRARFGEGVAGFHSGLGESQRASVWAQARSGQLRVLVGTRSAVFVPMQRLGLLVVDEEHDGSFKQQDGVLYSAREVAVMRARALQVPVMLGSATPSLESRHNAQLGRYQWLHLRERARAAAAPRMIPVDLRGRVLKHGLSAPLLEAMARHLRQGGQVLLFINRRGYAPALLCHQCAWVVSCRHCDARMTLHHADRTLLCHHCGSRQRPPRRCGRCGAEQMVPVGQGTERMEESLRLLFPDYRTERFDSDRMSRAGELERLIADTRAGRIHILVGTQMLAKGHDFDHLSLVGIVNADQALYSGDFRALERMGQQLVQVAGRAGRAQRRGEVLLQTHEPDHPLLRTLIDEGFEPFSEALMRERRLMGLPPYGYLALLRVEAPERAAAQRFAAHAKACWPSLSSVEVLGPAPAPMERRGGRYRVQLLLKSGRRTALQTALRLWVPQIAQQARARGLHWSIDVDPVDLF